MSQCNKQGVSRVLCLNSAHPPHSAERRQQGKPPEFDHAIGYVTKIKGRFGGDPSTYREFLEILHSYQKQKESIKDVLDKVSVLFQDHPDLLQDFTYFLPDAVQPQAKERLSRAAARSRERQAAARLDAERAREADRSATRNRQMRYMEDRDRAEMERERQRAADRGFERERDTALLGFGPGRTARGREAARRRRSAEDEMHFQLPPSERELFQRIKMSLVRGQWATFVKCLDMFARDIVTSQELLLLLTDVFGDNNAHLLQDLRIMLESRGGVELSVQDTWYTMPVSEIDFSKCEQCTPSYRALPAGYPVAACTARPANENAVLNDVWVSVPTGSEDFSFKHMRRNQYEEALFKCEDETYEVDMTIENNVSAIRALQPLSDEIKALSVVPNFEWHFRLDRRCLGVLHLKAIARVYGEYGSQVLELLKKNPGGAIPVVLRRLKQKDQEWRRARVELVKVWKDTQAKNYAKSLDHRSFYFKSADKRALTVKGLLADMKRRVEEAAAAAARPAVGAAAAVPAGPDADEVAAAAADTSALQAQVARDAQGNALSVSPTLHFVLRDTRVYSDAAAVLAYAVERHLPEVHKPRAAAVWRNFVCPFLGLAPDTMGQRAASMSHSLGPHRIGEFVGTPFGKGIVVDARLESEPPRDVYAHPEAAAAAAASDASQRVMYTVVLPWGSAVMNQDSVSPTAQLGSENTRGGTGTMAGTMQATGGATSSSAVVPPGHPAAALAGKVKPVAVHDSVLPPSSAGPAAARDGSALLASHAASGAEDAEASASLAGVSGGVAGVAEAMGPSDTGKTAAQLHVPFSSMQEELTAALGATSDELGPNSLVYTGTAEYSFFRMFQTLCSRLVRAQQLCKAAAAAPVMGRGDHVEERALAAAGGDMASWGSAADSVKAGGKGGRSAQQEAAGGNSSPEELYEHFLTALYGAIDGSCDGGKFEDECRVLMGTGSYVLFTCERLAQLAAKQLVSMTTDPLALKLRGLFEYHLGRLALAEATLAPAAATAENAVALRTYRANVAAAVAGRYEDVFAVQYVREAPEVVRVARAVAQKAGLGRGAARLVGGAAGGSGGDATAAAAAAQEGDEYVATLSIQYFGRHGTFGDELPGATLSLINTDVPVSVSRMVGEGVTLLSRGSLAPDLLAEDEAAARAALQVARAKGVPMLRRNVASGVAAARGAVLQSNALASVATPAGGAIAVTGGDDVLLRAKTDGDGDVAIA